MTTKQFEFGVVWTNSDGEMVTCWFYSEKRCRQWTEQNVAWHEFDGYLERIAEKGIWE